MTATPADLVPALEALLEEEAYTTLGDLAPELARCALALARLREAEEAPLDCVRTSCAETRRCPEHRQQVAVAQGIADKALDAVAEALPEGRP